MGVSCQFHTYTIATRAFISDPIDYADNKSIIKKSQEKPRLENFYRNHLAFWLTAQETKNYDANKMILVL